MTRSRNMTAYNMRRRHYYGQPEEEDWKNWREVFVDTKDNLQLLKTGTPKEKQNVREAFKRGYDKDNLAENWQLVTYMYNLLPDTEKPIFIDEVAGLTLQIYREALEKEIDLNDLIGAPPAFVDKIRSLQEKQISEKELVKQEIINGNQNIQPTSSATPSLTNQTSLFDAINKHKNILIAGVLVFVIYKSIENK